MNVRVLLIAIVALVVCALGAPAASAESMYKAKVLVRGATLHGANGLAVEADGHILVACGLGSEIVRLDPLTGHVLDRIRPAVVGAGPDDVAVGPDGSIYWTDYPTGMVGKILPDGTVVKKAVAPGMNPIAFTADGRLFVGQGFMGDGLFELDPATLLIKKTVIAPSGTPPFAAQLNGFDFGPDGKLYAPQPFLQTIVKIDPDTGAMTPVADVKAYGHPGSVEFDAQGKLFASMADTNKVLRVDTATGACTVWKELRGASLDNMAFDAKGRLLVSDAYNGKIYRIASGGGVRTLTRGGLMLPGGIALMRDDAGRERLYVADMWRVMKYRLPSGTFAAREIFSHLGGSIVMAWAVAPDDGKLILASWMSNAVQEWDPVAHTQVAIHTDFALPINAIRFQGDIVAAEIATGTVASKDAVTGAKTTIASGLLLPTGLAAIDDDLYVADWVTGSVLQIVDAGLPLVTPRLVAGGLKGPEGMAVNAYGKLLVVESATGSLMRINPTTGAVKQLVTGLKLGLGAEPGGGPPCWALSSVAVGKRGLMYVTGDIADVIYRVKKVPVAQ